MKSELGGRRTSSRVLIRVTTTVRIARRVEMRPKDKARVSPVVTRGLQLELAFRRWTVTYAFCLMIDVDQI